jgi:hypothetical protein
MADGVALRGGNRVPLIIAGACLPEARGIVRSAVKCDLAKRPRAPSVPRTIPDYREIGRAALLHLGGLDETLLRATSVARAAVREPAYSVGGVKNEFRDSVRLDSGREPERSERIAAPSREHHTRDSVVVGVLVVYAAENEFVAVGKTLPKPPLGSDSTSECDGSGAPVVAVGVGNVNREQAERGTKLSAVVRTDELHDGCHLASLDAADAVCRRRVTGTSGKRQSAHRESRNRDGCQSESCDPRSLRRQRDLPHATECLRQASQHRGVGVKLSVRRWRELGSAFKE